MKTRLLISLLALLMISASTVTAQQQPEQLNLPGDNLNLYAVMKIFQESETLEIFEKKLNDQEARINNLDLNGDNYIDYIKVVDNVEKNVHYIVLQVAVTPNENQDVAVFVVRKDPDGKAVIQLIGDEALYGKYYIVEPYYDTDPGTTPNPGYYGNNNNQQTIVVHHTTAYEVAAWPLVHFIFLPSYVVWHSPWYWGYYPTYWHPWTPWYWHEYYGYHYYWHDHYYGHYHHGNIHRHDNWGDNYYSHHRSESNTFHSRRERGDFNSTYSKPESIREGSAYFKKMNPSAVKSDLREPEVKNIRTAKVEKQENRNQVREKSNERLDKRSSQETRIINRSQPKQENIKPSKQENIKPSKQENVRPSKQERKSPQQKSDNKNIKKQESPAPAKTPSKDKAKDDRSKSKKESSKDSKSEERSKRK